jgi:hypothetical protein
MATKEFFVRVRDGSGREFICPLEALKDVSKASREELEQCVDSATVGRYSGNIDMVEKA